MAPATANVQLQFWFYDTLGAQIGSGPFVVDVDKRNATRNWYADTNAVGLLAVVVRAADWKLRARGINHMNAAKV